MAVAPKVRQYEARMTTRLKKPQVTFHSNTELAAEVPDLAKAEQFYREVLGFKVIERTAEYLAFDTGTLWLYVKQGPATKPVVPSLDVKNFHAAKRHLETAGCKIVRESPETRGLYFEDPFGLVWDVIERA